MTHQKGTTLLFFLCGFFLLFASGAFASDSSDYEDCAPKKSYQLILSDLEPVPCWRVGDITFEKTIENKIPCLVTQVRIQYKDQDVFKEIDFKASWNFETLKLIRYLDDLKFSLNGAAHSLLKLTLLDTSKAGSYGISDEEIKESIRQAMPPKRDEM